VVQKTVEGTQVAQKTARETPVAQTRGRVKGPQESASQQVVQIVVRAYQTLDIEAGVIRYKNTGRRKKVSQHTKRIYEPVFSEKRKNKTTPSQGEKNRKP
jgi:hypothetical protein